MASLLNSFPNLLRVGLIAGGLGMQSCGLMLESDLGILTLRRLGGVRSVETVQSRDWVDRRVFLEGTVGDRVPLVQGLVYELQDETGSVWVLTTDMDVQLGDRVLIQGAVRFQEMPELGTEAGEIYIDELQQVQITPDIRPASEEPAP